MDFGGVWLQELFGGVVKTAKLMFGCTAVWKSCLDPKALFQKAVFISFLGSAFCENDITTQEFEKITSYVISLL